MQEAGIVKKLQFSLGLCAVIIVFLTNQVIANITELQSLKKELETRPAVVQGSLDTSPANLDEIPITETELKAFISNIYKIFNRSANRSRTFKFPIISLISFVIFMFPNVWKHRKIFFR